MNTIWTSVNSILILLLMIVQFVILRQIGILLNRLSPGGARDAGVGPRIGESIPWIRTLSQNNSAVKSSLIIFTSTSCSVCKEVTHAAKNLAKFWNNRANILVVVEGQSSITADNSANGFETIAGSSEYREKLEIPMVPFAIMLDENGNVMGKGLVNHSSHLEGLLETLNK